MKTIPQLRLRGEGTFRGAYGITEDVASASKDIEAPSAGLVDSSTWFHVRWQKAAEKAGIKPLFGVEVIVPDGDKKPVAWALAENTGDFYRFSTASKAKDADTKSLFANAKGCVRFAGAAIVDPDCIDYIDVNPASRRQQQKAKKLHEETGKPIVLTSDNYYPRISDRSVFMAYVDRAKMTPQHILSLGEMRKEFDWLDDIQFVKAVSATHEAAERCVNKLPIAPLIHVPGSLREAVAQGLNYRLNAGHIAVWSPTYQARMERELAMIESKAFQSYFLVVADLITWAKDRMLVGPGRGSSAGSLVCYLLRITEVDPIVHDLLFERFIDVVRADLPDVDVDFNDQKRELCFDYLKEKYGSENIARIGNVNTMKPKSVMAQVCKKLGIPDHDRFEVANVLLEYSPGDARFGRALEDTLLHTEAGKKFAAKHPQAAVMYRLENHASHTGVHAAGVIVCNDPVSEYCTVGPDGIAHIDKPDAEALNLLKIDALGLRTLGVMEDAGVATSEELYALKLDDPKVFEIFNDHRYSGVFQFEGQAQRRIAAQVHIDKFEYLDHLTALSRPGPMGGGATDHYIKRAAGKEEIEYLHPSMEIYLGPTKGVILYQEQVMRICHEIGKFDWPQVSVVRKLISLRKGAEALNKHESDFVKGAKANGLKEDAAKELWQQMVDFGSYGFNKAHSVSYGIISYWAAWMKRYHALEYAAACLRGAKDDEQTMEILRDMADEGIHHTAFDIDKSDINWSVQDGKLMGGFMNLHGVGPAKGMKAIESRNSGKWTDKAKEKILAMPVKFSELYPLRAKYGDLMNDPVKHGCQEGSVIVQLNNIAPGQEVLCVVKVIKKAVRDENEAARVARRDGRIVRDPTLFLDIFVTDDTGTPFTLRVDRFVYFRESWARAAGEKLQEDDVLLVRGKSIPGFTMIKAQRIKCLNRPEALTE